MPLHASLSGSPEEKRWWEAPVVFGEELLLNLSELSESYAPHFETEHESPNFRVFERMLKSELSWTDTIHDAFTKIIRVALAAKYGFTSSRLSEYPQLVEKLVEQMEQDTALRKRALYLVFLFCRQNTSADL